MTQEEVEIESTFKKVKDSFLIKRQIDPRFEFPFKGSDDNEFEVAGFRINLDTVYKDKPNQIVGFLIDVLEISCSMAKKLCGKFGAKIPNRSFLKDSDITRLPSQLNNFWVSDTERLEGHCDLAIRYKKNGINGPFF